MFLDEPLLNFIDPSDNTTDNASSTITFTKHLDMLNTLCNNPACTKALSRNPYAATRQIVRLLKQGYLVMLHAPAHTHLLDEKLRIDSPENLVFAKTKTAIVRIGEQRIVNYTEDALLDLTQLIDALSKADTETYIETHIALGIEMPTENEVIPCCSS